MACQTLLHYENPTSTHKREREYNYLLNMGIFKQDSKELQSKQNKLSTTQNSSKQLPWHEETFLGFSFLLGE